MWLQARHRPHMRPTYESLERRLRALIADVVREGQRAGEFGPADADDVATALSAMLDGLGVQVTLEHPDVTPERMVAPVPDDGLAAARVRAAARRRRPARRTDAWHGPLHAPRRPPRRRPRGGRAGAVRVRHEPLRPLGGRGGAADLGQGRRRPLLLQLLGVHGPRPHQGLREALRRAGDRVELRLDAGHAGQAQRREPLRRDLPDRGVGRQRCARATGCGGSITRSCATTSRSRASPTTSTTPGTTPSRRTRCPTRSTRRGSAGGRTSSATSSPAPGGTSGTRRPRARSTCSTTSRRRSAWRTS